MNDDAVDQIAAEEDHESEETHKGLSGIARLGDGDPSENALRGVAGFAFDGDGTALPCAVTVASPGSPLVIRIHGDLDIHSAAFLMRHIERAIDILTVRTVGGANRDLVIDLNHSTYMDSRGMGVLIKAARDVQAVGGRLSLLHPSPKVGKVFTLTGMDKILTVLD